MDPDDGVVASALEVIEIAEVASGGRDLFTEQEQAYAAARADPERRLAARLAAKRAGARLLGPGLGPEDVEVVRAPGGPPSLRFSPRARRRLDELGVERTLVSLTHGREQAAAAVLFLRGGA